MKTKLFNVTIIGLGLTAAFVWGANAGQYKANKYWETRETKTIQAYEEGLDYLSDIVNDAYGEDTVYVSQNEDGNKQYSINASKINFINRIKVESSKK